MATKKGNQKPTKSVVLKYKQSKGKEAIELYNSTTRDAQKWQEKLITNIMGTTKDGLWTHTKFGYSVPRRNGKNEVVAIREMWGICNGEKILHTAHRTTTSHSAWERLCQLLSEANVEYKSTKQFGLETIVTENGKISFRTRSSKGGLGEGFDLLIIDEAQEYTDDQESALKYVVSDSQNPQTIFCGTPPTVVSAGTVFTKYRAKTLEGKTLNGGWAEWSVDVQTDPEDVSAWYETNPSLGTILTERKIRDEIGTDDIDFNIQRLGLWIKYNQKSAISENEWNRLKEEKLPKLSGKLYVGIKYGHDGKNVALSVAARTKTDDKVFVEVIDCKPVRVGNDWIIDFLKQADVETVEVDGASGQNLLSEEMKEAKLKSPSLPSVKWVISANAGFEQGLYSGSSVPSF